MAGGDSYKEFDSSSIVTTTTTEGTIKFGRLRLRKRDLVFGGIAMLALIMVLILAIVLAIEVSKSDDKDDGKADRVRGPAASTSGGGDQAQCMTPPCPSGGGDQALCMTPPCLKAAHYQKSTMDDLFQPCEDFYSFACGHFDEENPQTYLLPDVTPTEQIRLENTIKMIDLMIFPVERDTVHSYERKLRDFFYSCTNHFDKMEVRGRPLVEQVLRPYGKSFLLDDDFDPSEFHLTSALQKTHVDYWTAAFFRLEVVTDPEDWSKRIIEMDYGGLGMHFPLYLHPNYATQALSLYKEYMTHVLSLVSIDAGLEPNNDTIDTFANDVIDVEYHIALVTSYTSPHSGAHYPDNRMTLGELNTLVNNSIDFVAYLKYLFNESPSLITEDTQVAVRQAGYFHLLGSIIYDMESSDDGKRKLSNYLLWTLINRFSHDLSWDYVHAKRKLNNYLLGQKDDSSGAYYCFETARMAMGDAMDGVFIKNYVKDVHKAEADTIRESIQKEVLEGIKGLDWMSEADKLAAHDKIEKSLYKIAYADYMVDENYMDAMYYPASIDPSDYFGNILNLNKLYRTTYNKRLQNPHDKTMWAYHIFDPAVEYYNPWHELVATAAVFQNPLFSPKGPAYYNYGSVGSMIAKQLIHAVDEVGNQFRLDGKNLGRWWANATVEHYNTIRKCATDAQKGTDLGTYDIFGQAYKPNITNFAADYVPELLADASGLRLAYKAYHATVKKTGKDQMPVGFPGMNTKQLFFMAFAQANCQNTPPSVKLYNLNGNLRYPSKNKVNLAVSQVPEFAEAFQCKQGQPMYPAKQCTLF